ncbi:hypothetical protein NDU88_005369, partial [Pleurodeles waltl]
EYGIPKAWYFPLLADYWCTFDPPSLGEVDSVVTELSVHEHTDDFRPGE